MMSTANNDHTHSDLILCRRLLWFWLLIRTVVWVVATAATQPNAPLDLIEWLAWGNQFAWGYPKHPPLPAWVAGVFATLSPGDVWGVYIASYLLAACCLWTAWRVGLEFLAPRQALLGALCLDGLMYLTGDTSEFSNNVALNVAWAFTVLCFVRAVRTGKLSWWLGLGTSVGLGILCKYTLGVLLAPLFGYMHFNGNARRHLKRPGPYLAAILALALFAPHALWLLQNDFITLQYAAERSAAERSPVTGWIGHLKNPVGFLVAEALLLIPVFLVLAPLVRRPRAPRAANLHAECEANVLHWVVLGPVVLLLGLSLATGCQLRLVWGSPLWTFVGVWILALAGTDSPIRMRWACRAWAVVATSMLVCCTIKNVAAPYVLNRPTRVTYPGRALADEIARRWHSHCAEPFPIVAGEAWRAGNACCYAPQRPVIYSAGFMGWMAFDPEHTPWTDDADLLRRGGVLLWDARQDGDLLPDAIRARFPSADTQNPIVLPYQTRAGIPPDRIGIAIVWPANDRPVSKRSD
ncbi:MAG: glycosyltransferase family 39 protein [Planctomycetes bacterium]|nr:glycosyltransferase family 39 protein [Planctomycetota bacterium]